VEPGEPPVKFSNVPPVAIDAEPAKSSQKPHGLPDGDEPVAKHNRQPQEATAAVIACRSQCRNWMKPDTCPSMPVAVIEPLQ